MQGKKIIHACRKSLLSIWLPVSLIVYFYLYHHDILAFLERLLR